MWAQSLNPSILTKGEVPNHIDSFIAISLWWFSVDDEIQKFSICPLKQDKKFGLLFMTRGDKKEKRFLELGHIKIKPNNPIVGWFIDKCWYPFMHQDKQPIDLKEITAVIPFNPYEEIKKRKKNGLAFLMGA